VPGATEGAELKHIETGDLLWLKNLGFFKKISFLWRQMGSGLSLGSVCLLNSCFLVSALQC
jgi:hypothetical protein